MPGPGAPLPPNPRAHLPASVQSQLHSADGSCCSALKLLTARRAVTTPPLSHRASQRGLRLAVWPHATCSVQGGNPAIPESSMSQICLSAALISTGSVPRTRSRAQSEQAHRTSVLTPCWPQSLSSRPTVQRGAQSLLSLLTLQAGDSHGAAN